MLDKYYTPKDVVEMCVAEVLKLNLEISDVIEPSAGNGAFITSIEEMFNVSKTFYDIAPEHDLVIQQDFLTLKEDYKNGRLVIGNPPFGDRNALVLKFFKKAVCLGDYIAFILPISQLNNTKQLYEFDLVKSIDLGVKNYSGKGLHCCFNIYKRPDCGLNTKPKVKSVDGLEVIEYRRDKLDSYRKKVKDGFFHSICSWGAIGSTPNTVGAYSMELYFYSECKHIQDVVKGIVWQEEVKSISAKRLPKGTAIEIIERKLSQNRKPDNS